MPEELEIPKEPSLHSLHVMVALIYKDMQIIKKSQDDTLVWQKEHQTHDNKEFSAIKQDIKDMNRYGASIALVASVVTAAVVTGGKAAVGYVAKKWGA